MYLACVEYKQDIFSTNEVFPLQIVSKKNESLEISSPYQIILKGNEGLSITGKEIIWITGLDLYLKSVVCITFL